MSRIAPVGIFIFLCFIKPDFCFSQALEAKAGFGNFEGFNIGLCHTKGKYKFEYGLGTDFNIYKQGACNEIHASVGRSISGTGKILHRPAYLDFKALVWNIRNQSNVFSAVSLSGEGLYKFKIGNDYQVGIYGGIVWNSVFRYERRNYQDVGFVKDWQPNFGFTLYRKLK